MTVFGVADLGGDATLESLTITALEFDVVWEHLRLGPMPLVLKVPSPGKTRDERARIVRHAWTGLEERGLGRQVGLDPRLEELLALIAQPEREVDGRLWLGRGVRLLAAARGDNAVLAVLDDDQLSLRRAAATGLPREAVSVLPPLAAGPGHSITLPSADLDAAAEEAGIAEGLEVALRGRGVRHEDAHALAAMVADADHRGQFGTAARNRWGQRERADRVVSFFDTPRGRYVQLRRSAPGLEPWSTVSPGDARRLGHLVEELLTETSS